jgi:hypothetical protein
VYDSHFEVPGPFFLEDYSTDRIVFTSKRYTLEISKAPFSYTIFGPQHLIFGVTSEGSQVFSYFESKNKIRLLAEITRGPKTKVTGEIPKDLAKYIRSFLE